jgi:hypothetical protein
MDLITGAVISKKNRQAVANLRTWAQIRRNPNGTHSRMAVAAMSDPGDKESAKAAVREWRRSH